MPVSLPPAGSIAFQSIQHPRSGTHENGVIPQKSIKRPLEVWKAIHVNWGNVRSDEGCPLYSGDNFTAHHNLSVEARGPNVIFL